MNSTTPAVVVSRLCCFHNKVDGRYTDIKGRHGSRHKGNFERGLYKRKACLNILEDRESHSLFVTIE